MKAGVRARYTLEFKQEAVRLVRGGEKLSSEGRTLGVSAQSLDNWVKAEASGRLRDVRGKALTAEQMEIAGPWSFSPFLLVRNSPYMLRDN
jgi:transposase-like protein